MLPSATLDRVPTDAGVYLFKDASGEIVYVGKAKNLRTRVRQYFRPGGDERFFVAAGYLGRSVVDIDTIVVADEKAALLLENHLIKQHQPKFNVKLRDDKQYLVLRLKKPATDPDAKRAAAFPRVEVVRNIKDDDARYFGPYHSATSARQTLRILNRHFQLRTCTDHVIESRGRTCLQYQIKRCPGPCAIPVEPQSYREQVDDVVMFLSGKDKELLARLNSRMRTRADAEDFEVAAAIRDSIGAVERTLSRQDVVQDDFVDQDVWGLYREADAVEVAVLFVRSGKLVGRRTFTQKNQELADADVLTEHIQLYYASGTLIPDEIVVGVDLEGSDAIVEWLSGVRGKKIKVIEPRRGTRVRLVDLADKNAAASASSRRGRDDDAAAILEKLKARLGLHRLPRRIECFDIAHIQGRETVASMVTFVDGVPAKNLYRKFKIKTSGNDDFASMYEVLTRRFKRAVEAGINDANVPRDVGDAPNAWAPPDLLVIDGGKGQLGSAIAALTDLGIVLDREDSMDVVGLAKERDLESGAAPDRVYQRNVKEPTQLRANSAELYVLARIRDEAHRFANSFHRQQRGKSTLRSELDDIPGIGAKRRIALLKQFGSVRGIRAATVDELTRAPGMTRAAATAIREYFDTQPDTSQDLDDVASPPDEPIDD